MMDDYLNYCEGCMLSPCGLLKQYCELSTLDYEDNMLANDPINV